MTVWHYPADKRGELPFMVCRVCVGGEARVALADERCEFHPCGLSPNQVRALLPALKHFGETGMWENDLVQYGLSDERAAEWAEEVKTRGDRQ